MPPENKDRQKLFYGWYIVIGLGVVGMVSTGMGGINLGLFVPAMGRELGISFTYFGWAFSARLIGFSLTSWFIGIILDRYGARIPMAVTGLLAGMIMVALSCLKAGWQLVGLYFLLGMIGMEGGGGNLYQVVPLSRWFITKRGKAMGLAVLGMTVGIFVFSPLSAFLIATHGWRSAWLILGCSGSLVIIIVALSVIRKDPQSMGLLPDGVDSEDHSPGLDDDKMTVSADEYSWTRAEAVRTYAFWALIMVHGLRTLGSSTMHVFRIPFYIEQGISPQLVGWAISVEAVIAALFSVVAGRAVDRIQSRFVVSISLFLFVAMFAVTMNVEKTWHVFLAAGLFGASAGSYIVALNALWPAYFGSVHIGSIRGLSLVSTLFFGTIGAPISGLVKDMTGSYFPAWTVSLLLLILAAILMLVTKKPCPKIDRPLKANLLIPK